MNIEFIINDYLIAWYLLFRPSFCEEVQTIKEKFWTNHQKQYISMQRENVEFIAEYKIYDPNKDENNLTMFGTVLAEDGSTYQMQTETQSSDDGDKKHYIYYDVPYLSAGTYTVRIYHYPEETSVEPPVMKDKTEKNTDVIVIDG